MGKIDEKPIVTDEEKAWLEAFDQALLDRKTEKYSTEDFRRANIIRNKIFNLEHGWYHIKRQHRFPKSKMLGANNAYQKMYDILKPIDDPDSNGALYGLGWAMGDMPYHGWVGEAAKAENQTYNAVCNAYLYLMNCLEDALGIESYDYASDLKNSPDGQFLLINTKTEED